MWINWLKVYRYHWLKNKFYFVLTVLGLAFGLSLLTMALLSYEREQTYEQWNPNTDNIFMVVNITPDYAYPNQSYALGRTLKEQYPVIEDFLYYFGYDDVVMQNGVKSHTTTKAIMTQRNFFDFFPYPFVYGSAQQFAKEKNNIALEEEKAIELFGKGVNPIGKQLNIEEEWVTVSGVFTVGNKKSAFMPEVVIPLMDEVVATDTDWSARSFAVLLKTQQPTSALEAVNQVLDTNYFEPEATRYGTTVAEFKQRQLNNIQLELAPLSTLRWKEAGQFTPEDTPNSKMMYIFWGLAGVIFILSLVNFINFSTTHFLMRIKEMGVRRIFGGNTSEIRRQIVFESAITLCIALLISIFFMGFMIPYVELITASTIELSLVKLGVCFLLLLCSVSIITGGVIAYYVSRQKVSSLLKGNFISTQKGSILKNVFLVFQLAIACFFVSSTMIFNQQVHYMLNKDLGFKGDQVIGFSFNEALRWDNTALLLDKYRVFKKEIEQIKGVEGVSTSDQVFGRSSMGSTTGSFEGKDFSYHIGQVDYGYFDLFQIPIVKGRDLNPAFASDSIQHIVVNEAFVREAGVQDPVGKTFTSLEGPRIIIGVVQDYNAKDLEEKVSPIVYYHYNSLTHKMGSIEKVYVKVNTAEHLERTLKEIEKRWKAFNMDSASPFEYEFVDKQFQRTFEQVLMERKVLNSLSIGVVFIALFGLFAIASFAINGKLKEIAIRKVLGANSFGLLRKLTVEYVAYCSIGFALTIFPSYYFLNYWLSHYTYRIEIGWEVYGWSFISILILTLCMVLQKARKAVNVDILHYIKYE